MNSILSEKEYQKFILERLEQDNGYIIRDSKKYDRYYAVDRELVFKFLNNTQPDKMQILEKIYKGDLEETVINYVNQEITKTRGSLLDVLKHGVDISNQHLELMYTKPATTFNKELLALYDMNIFSVIQHSTGSGKTNSIAWLAHRLTSLHDSENRVIFDNVIIVTDRVVVDRQLQKAIMGMEHKAGLIRVMDDKCNSEDLAIAIKGNTKIIATTIQKFPYIVDSVAGLKNKRFAVLIDEAHSSTSGKDMAAVTMALGSGEVDINDTDTEDLVLDEIGRHGKQDNVSFIAFTATPKPTTLQLFGRVNTKGQREAFHIYSMKQAIEEGFILDVLQNYTTYKTFYRINKEIEDDPKLKTNAAKRQIARFVELHDTNIAQRIEVIVEHFRNTVMQELGGTAKAMVITASRQGAVKYKQAFEQYIQKKGYDMKALVAFSGKVKLPDDDHEYTEVGMNGFSEDKLTKEFDKDDYQVLLVANKYQT